MDAFTPAQTTELVSRIGAKKARMRIDKMFINSFMGGALISFGCALALSTNASPWFQVRLRISGAVFFLFGSASTGTHHPPFKMCSLTTCLRSNNSKSLLEEAIANALLTDRQMHLVSSGPYPPWSFLLV
jgi:hypothetical protein